MNAPAPHPERCPTCKRSGPFWRSKYGMLMCSHCFPQGTPKGLTVRIAEVEARLHVKIWGGGQDERCAVIRSLRETFPTHHNMVWLPRRWAYSLPLAHRRRLGEWIVGLPKTVRVEGLESFEAVRT